MNIKLITADEARAGVYKQATDALVTTVDSQIRRAISLQQFSVVFVQSAPDTFQAIQKVFTPLGYEVYKNYRNDVVISWKKTEK